MIKKVLFFRGLITSFGVSLSLIALTPSWAQPPFQNPLQVETFADPLLPEIPVIRPLSPLEQFRLKEPVEQLNQQAQQVYQEGKVEEAFQVWYRELRLRQKLDRIEEVEALGRVGEVAWQENRSSDFRNIEERLRVIEKTARAENNRDLLAALAENYEQMRELDGAIALYEILAEDRENPTPLLEKIAQLHADQFHYQDAARTYEQLLAEAEAQGNTQTVINYLKQLKNWYEQADNPEAGIETKQRLIEIYQEQKNLDALPTLMVALADDYQTLEQFAQASRTYQEAFKLARSQQKYAIAAIALENLAELYRNDSSLDTTLDIYQQLIVIQEQSYDYYGLMVTYDKIGEIYQQQNHQKQARIAYEKALEFAQSLSYQEDYFRNKIQNLQSSKNRSIIDNCKKNLA
ncbi:MAG: tetratricopeptide repeat protein [Cyanobacteria bacterium]|jgi:tetratricopeptide (TPR) repeat protein|nr:tetratricopeptide repeat protein [Cyanobacteria bacterium GSL.Bin1]